MLAIVIALGRSESRPSITPVFLDWTERTDTQNDSRYGGNDCTILMTCDDKFDVAMFLLSMQRLTLPAFICSFSFPLHFHVMSMPFSCHTSLGLSRSPGYWFVRVRLRVGGER